MTSSPIRVLIADDHPLFTAGMQAALSDLPEIELVGVAETGAQAVSAALDISPDVVVMDLHMPDLNGIEATRQITEVHPQIAVLVLTMFEDPDSVLAAMRAGARGYLLKGAKRAQLLRAIQAVATGEVIFGGAAANQVIKSLTTTRGANGARAFPDLTDRELEILELVAQAMSNHEIARRLYLSEKTIRNNLSNILTKLQVTDRAHAIVRARQAGLGEASGSTGP